jgi:hypothetical protein
LQLAVNTASQGQSPSGKQWKPLKGGGQALQGAAGRIELRSHPRGFQLRVKPHVVSHRTGPAEVWAINQYGSRGRKFNAAGQAVKRSHKKITGKAAREFKAAGGTFRGPKIPSRRILPTKNLPKAWAARFTSELGELFRQAMNT